MGGRSESGVRRTGGRSQMAWKGRNPGASLKSWPEKAGNLGASLGKEKNLGAIQGNYGH